jgi:16S rRNA (uracil1498-N3)-methyltransferase
MRAPSSHRFLFYADGLTTSASSIALAGEERHHLSRVLRMNAGDFVFVTNGRGAIARCRVEAIGREAATLAVLGFEEEDTASRPVILALAVLKKDAFARAVEQCTELGITTCVPFVSERSHVSGYPAEYLDRVRRIALAAMKQSFRSVLPVIEETIDFADLPARVREASFTIVGDAEGEALGARLPTGSMMIVVGPEAGFSEGEREVLAAAGARAVRVSPHRLRSETAAASLVAMALATGPAGSSRVD